MNMLFQALTLTGLFAGGFFTYAQAQKADEASKTQKLTIDIEVNENGEVTKIKKEIDADAGEDIEAILKDLDILDGLDISSKGERIEIKVRKEVDGEADSDIGVNVASPQFQYQWFGTEDASHEKRALLGVFITNNAEGETEGALVTGIVDGSAADKAGLQEGDVIVAIGNEKVLTEKDLRDLVAKHEPNETVSVEFIRNGKNEHLSVTLGETSDEMSMMFYGPDMHGKRFHFEDSEGKDMEVIIKDMMKQMPELEDLNFEWETSNDAGFLGVTPAETEAKEGVVIGKVVPNSAAEKMGLNEGDVITKLNGEKVADFGQLAAIISAKKPGESLEVEYERDGKKMKAVGDLGKREHGPVVKHIRRSAPNWSEADASINRSFKEVNVVIELKDCTAEDEKLLADPANVDFGKQLVLKRIEFAPNPNDGNFNLKFELPEKRDTRVMVFDQGGRKVFEELLVNFEGEYSNRIDISAQPNGVYFLIVAQGNAQFTRKIVKQ
jgi:PDZ domain-containing secreted protein